ncbi:hypothetical protein CAPTEDRAFT_186449 [Capitella teleta]|uniref:Uncharacterized protein n=1 Tax=Capitella teleta TaxID=283909 RepID=R7U7C3_CAPTE|nr:hypothetical protein CAPTEDRAFT_186449 [Capitella teleta]|eukprot:ELU02026.1 hypothetical protein CAPTEDRAFT_186449 [Capitella teleta]
MTFKDHMFEMSHPVPDWMNGIYLKNGMGLFDYGGRNFTHPFDALAKLHSFKFEGTSKEVAFNAQFVKSNFYKIPCFVYGGKSVHALSDFWTTYEIDLSTLDTIKQVTPPMPNAGFAFGPIPSCAHPVKEFGTDNLINFYSLINPFGSHSVNVIRIKSSDETEVLASISRDEISYMHSLAATNEYVIILAHPVYINWKQIGKDAIETLEWHPERLTDIYAVHLATGEVTHLQTEALFFLHNINAYQEGDYIIVDHTTYTDMSMMHHLSMKNIRSAEADWPKSTRPQIKRIKINLTVKSVKIDNFSTQPGLEFVNQLDLPVINQNFAFKEYCYVYGMAAGDSGMQDARLVKKNLCYGVGDRVWSKENHFPSEPWFIPNPNGSGEDDGVLLTIVLDGHSDVSYLLILDGRTFEEVNLGYLPTWIPYTLHGRFFHHMCSDEKQTCS